ncbi:MAG: ABC transporter permease, partial [Bacillota bacterium]
MNEIVEIGLTRLVSAYIFVLILLAIVKYKKIGHKSQIILASLRMTIQLVLVGFVLTYVFENP